MTHPALISSLRSPRCYPHPVDHVHVVETHISWVVLTGKYAYKIKKPVVLGFLDFSTLALRRFYCDEELRLNRRLAADLYLDVVAITGGVESPMIGGAGPVLEYAVKMRQFREDGLLDRVQARGELHAAHIEALAQQISAFHRSCARAPAGSDLGAPDSVLRPALQNFEQAHELLADPAERARLEPLQQWSSSTGRGLHAAFEARQRDGFVRECHGDLHLGNAFLENDTVRIFDCIEFNANLRWIDVMSEVAFMVMDLWHRNHPDLARLFLNAYLEHSGDYAGLVTLPFYLVYRAMVRAKVALLRSAPADGNGPERQPGLAEYRRFIGLAETFAARQPVWVVFTHGVSGSGKSFLARQLLERSNAIRIRSDIERKRLHGLGRDAPSGSPVGAGIYTEEATRLTYERLAMLAATILDAGWPVIADAGFPDRWQRDLLRAEAVRRGVRALLLDLHAAEATLLSRVRGRSAGRQDPSEATPAVLERQIRGAHPLGADERLDAVAIDAETEPDLGRILAILAEGARTAPVRR